MAAPDDHVASSHAISLPSRLTENAWSNRALVISEPEGRPWKSYRFVPLRFDVEDADRLRAGEVLALLFLAEVFLAEVFLAEDVLADDDRAGDFLAGDFLAGDFLAGDFLALLFAAVFAPEGRFAGDLLAEDDFLAFCLRWRARAVPPTAAPARPLRWLRASGSRPPSWQPSSPQIPSPKRHHWPSPRRSRSSSLRPSPRPSDPFADRGPCLPPPSRCHASGHFLATALGTFARVAADWSSALSDRGWFKTPSSRARRGPSESAGRP